jgi:hypothetical protein
VIECPSFIGCRGEMDVGMFRGEVEIPGKVVECMSSRGEGGGDDKADNDSARRDDDGTQKPRQRLL